MENSPQDLYKLIEAKTTAMEANVARALREKFPTGLLPLNYVHPMLALQAKYQTEFQQVLQGPSSRLIKEVQIKVLLDQYNRRLSELLDIAIRHGVYASDAAQTNQLFNISRLRLLIEVGRTIIRLAFQPTKVASEIVTKYQNDKQELQTRQNSVTDQEE